MADLLSVCNSRFRRSVEDLKTLVRIPSVSFPGFDAGEVRRSAVAVARLLKARGLQSVRILTLPGAHPYVYGERLGVKDAPTLLLYAHHDVQPPGRRELWKSPAFDPAERSGRLWGRGSADDKAGVVVHTSAVSAWIEAEGRLPLNVKLIVEGEEEIGSTHLEAFLRKYKRLLQADAMVLTDTGNFDVGIPSLTTTLRGSVGVDVTVRTSDHPLHSGMWGGPLPDPVQALAKMIASLTNASGRIAVKGLADGIRPMGRAEAANLRSLRCTERVYRRQSGVLSGVELVGGKAPPILKMWRLPSIAVNAIQASSRKDCANIVNESAWCRGGVRIVPGQNPQRALRLLKRHLLRTVPWGARVEFSKEIAGPAWSTDTRHPAFAAARRALAAGYGREAVFVGCGGSIPFVGPFAKALGGAPALLIGVEDPRSNPHSENESLHLGDFRKAIRGAALLYRELAGVKGFLRKISMLLALTPMLAASVRAEGPFATGAMDAAVPGAQMQIADIETAVVSRGSEEVYREILGWQNEGIGLGEVFRRLCARRLGSSPNADDALKETFGGLVLWTKRGEKPVFQQRQDLALHFIYGGWLSAVWGAPIAEAVAYDKELKDSQTQGNAFDLDDLSASVFGARWVGRARQKDAGSWLARWASGARKLENLEALRFGKLSAGRLPGRENLSKVSVWVKNALDTQERIDLSGLLSSGGGIDPAVMPISLDNVSDLQRFFDGASR
ncbi:MAG: hypothetical protein A3G41_06535 [Elusimicrobia bacterium RIFCSPLOWO2_12_FULL_59_9]|nr:MAG: hypothetical protein A3G41_06535 [Elusimicrobia bacterium RIFCSPLOWO2_12_FULL_59_9]